MSERTTVCLTMIVKDEAETLPRLFAGVRHHIDYWVICDTGSTDGTQALIGRELADIPGELHERPWVDFGTNRTESVMLSRGKADYLLILDADSTFEAPAGAFSALTDDAYMFRYLYGGTQYYTKRVVRADLAWRYIGSVHEYIFSDEEETTGRLEDVVMRTSAAGASRTGRFERDLVLLRGDVEADPHDPRARYYLAQTLRDLASERGDAALLAEALEAFQTRADMPGWDEETYYAQLQTGVAAERIGDWPRAMDAYIRAWEMRPQRLEAVYNLAVGLREREMYRTAHRFTRMAGALAPLPMPPDVLFVEPWVYEWGMLFEYSITAYWVGEFRQSLTACKRLLGIESLPEAHRRQTEKNLKHAVRESARREAERREQARPKPRQIVATGTSTRRR